jgi:hypothetical protein
MHSSEALRSPVLTQKKFLNPFKRKIWDKQARKRGPVSSDRASGFD